MWSSAAGAAEGKAAFSLQPSCGAQQPLGRIPAAGNDKLNWELFPVPNTLS